MTSLKEAHELPPIYSSTTSSAGAKACARAGTERAGGKARADPWQVA